MGKSPVLRSTQTASWPDRTDRKLVSPVDCASRSTADSAIALMPWRLSAARPRMYDSRPRL
nr:hypothetical protein [Achromobacter dolens]